uniref:Uncharacterized protein n=1 Tax=Arundo donax TaxID=35708 RepID=A0A0A8Y337_ARUDO
MQCSYSDVLHRCSNPYLAMHEHVIASSNHFSKPFFHHHWQKICKKNQMKGFPIVSAVLRTASSDGSLAIATLSEPSFTGFQVATLAASRDRTDSSTPPPSTP